MSIKKKKENDLVAEIVETKKPNVEQITQSSIVIPEYKMRCDVCFLLENCPYYKPKNDCELKIKANMESGADLKSFLLKTLSISAERILRQYHMELQSGGVVTKELSMEIRQFVDLAQKIKELSSEQSDTLKIEAKGKGIISQIFGKFKE